ncbi:GNAT family N-acetyltransferase [Desulfogranum mediterraneum]|uniref:GNAT family N-acetyltransferase n=1 Tax=Desulfogranum mediterraneum TaxID=160661 RepID=UPI00041951BC|nr:GNAT family N-acetyltransferase [Desulfogranum mediterraneum]
MESVELKGYLPGAIGRITELHADYYCSRWGLGPRFEAGIAAGLSELISRYDEERARLWTVVSEGRVEGSIAIDSRDLAARGAFLRWFILAPELQGQGLGRRLLSEAVSFCRAKGYGRIYLWTFPGLHHSRRLYQSLGFQLAEERPGCQWGTEMVEQQLVLELGERI